MIEEPDKHKQAPTNESPQATGSIDKSTTTDFNALVEEHADFVYNVAFKMMGNPRDAEYGSQ